MNARPTIYDVAKLAGVSTATVSRALNGTGQIAPSTRATIEAAVEQLGYRANTIARSLVTKSTQTIAAAPARHRESFLRSARQHPAYALSQGYTMLLCTTEGDAEREEQYLTLLRAKQVHGALVDGLRLPPIGSQRFVKDGFPIVCLDRDVDSDSIPLVQVDNRLGGRLATEHLTGLGHSRIGHVTRAHVLGISDERLAGYWVALVNAGIEADPRLVAEGHFTEEGGYAGARALLDASPDVTAIFAANDLSALGVLRRTRRKRPSCARRRLRGRLRRSAALRLHLTAADDDPAARHRDRAACDRDPARPDARQAGRRKLLHLLEPKLIVRASTAKPLTPASVTAYCNRLLR